MKVAIIDDERDSRELSRSLLTQYCAPCEVIWEAETIEEAYQAVQEQLPDLILLDIHLTDGSGFDLLDRLEKRDDFAVIFLTAFDKYAVKAFRYAAVDYLLKPIDYRLLVDAVNKFRTKSGRQEQALNLENLIAIKQSKKLGRLIVPTEKGNYYIKFDDLSRLYSEDNYTYLQLQNGEKILSSKSIGEFEDILPEDQFFRPHNTQIVHREYVTHVQRQEGGFAQMSNGELVEISRRRKADFLLWLAQ
jgi:two-component system, LytTR family, response regulator